MKKPEHDPLSYEHPLPLDLLPFQQRNDAYDSIGTAFALGENTYVTAGHVLLAGVNALHGAPALRGSDGRVHLIDRIRRFSVHEDFVVFSLQDDPAPPGFEANRNAALDEPVLAVGNALGEGVVIREGLHTSDTPEDQDGRWKWIRFSAAASPGNSGGPLLDGNAHVIGIVIGKSENENLNYGLPIARVLDAPEGIASFDQRALTSLPWLQATRTYTLKEQFKLPLRWTEFVHSYQALVLRHTLAMRAQLIAANADVQFPKGTGTEALLYGADNNDFLPWMVVQQANGDWSAMQPGFRTTELPGDGAVRVAALFDGSLLLQVVRSNQAADDAFYSDSTQFMDVALKGLNLRRPVGADQVRVVGAGKAAMEELYTDHNGRRWQVRAWPLPFMELWMITLMLPTPDGYAGIVQYAPSTAYDEVRDQALRYTDLMEISYQGTLAQWRAFLARRTLLPDLLREVSLSPAPEWKLGTPRFDLRVPEKLFVPDEKSILTLTTGFQPPGAQPGWNINDAWIHRDRQMRAGLGLARRSQPPASARVELRNAWTDMDTRAGAYDGTFSRESNDVYALSTVVDIPGTAPGMVATDELYALTLHVDSSRTGENPVGLERQLSSALQLREHARGEVVAASSRPRSSRAFSERIDAIKATIRSTAAERGLVGQRDLRGRSFDDDLDALASKLADGESSLSDEMNEFREGTGLLLEYWTAVAGINQLRSGLPGFIARHGLPARSASSPTVAAAETELRAALADDAQRPKWSGKARVLRDALLDERRELLKAQPHRDVALHARHTDCPAPANFTAGADGPAKFANNLPPTDDFYPPQMRRLQIEGSVIVRVHVEASGCADQFGVEWSSGSDELDDGALAWAETANFLPAVRDGKAIGSDKEFKVTFQMRGY